MSVNCYIDGLEDCDWDEESSDSGSVSASESEYWPTPKRTICRQTKGEQRSVPIQISPIALPNEVGFMTLPQLERFVESINAIRGCKTPNCEGVLVPVAVKSSGLGGALSITFVCNGCALKWAKFDTCAHYKLSSGSTSAISVFVQVAFILAGSTHATYYKTLQHALGMKTVSKRAFLRTIERMHPVVKAMLDELCEAAKQEMKEKREDEIGSWKCAVTTADGTWQTRGWHSKNATFTIRNYLNGALLYYHHLCQKGSDKVIQEPLYGGTSKGAEGHAARITFQRAKKEGMQIAVHWQDADSSAAKVVSEMPR